MMTTTAALENILMMVEASTPDTAIDDARRQRFGEIYARFDNLISKVCFGFCHTRQEFEDLRQDTYLNVWHGLDRFRGDSKLSTWVYRIALNTCVSEVRRRRPAGSVGSIPIEEFADVIDEDQERRERLCELHEMIGQLGSEDRAIVMMWLDELSYDEIASVMGMPRNTVATRLRRAKEKLANFEKQ